MLSHSVHLTAIWAFRCSRYSFFSSSTIQVWNMYVVIKQRVWQKCYFGPVSEFKSDLNICILRRRISFKLVRLLFFHFFRTQLKCCCIEHNSRSSHPILTLDLELKQLRKRQNTIEIQSIFIVCFRLNDFCKWKIYRCRKQFILVYILST